MASVQHRLFEREMPYLALLVTLVIILGAIIPLATTSHRSGKDDLALNVAHLVAYSICSFLWGRSLKSNTLYAVVMVALIPLTEFIQFYLPYRNASVGDLFSNLAGTLIGAFISKLF